MLISVPPELWRHFTEAGVASPTASSRVAKPGDRTGRCSRSDMAALRQAEQRAAAAEVGVTEIDFLGLPRWTGYRLIRASTRHQSSHSPAPPRNGS